MSVYICNFKRAFRAALDIVIGNIWVFCRWRLFATGTLGRI
jgi:hypothetical protein